MSSEPLAVYLGRKAAKTIGEQGWQADHFDLMLGASGGPKWLILSQLDRVLFGRFLAGGTRPLAVLGSSIGSWRHACLGTRDPVAALERMETHYLAQEYGEKPSPAEVSAISLRILEQVLGATGAAEILHNPRIHTHIVAARGRGLAASTATAPLATGMGTAALGNALSRQLLKLHFQRVVFHSGASPAEELVADDFQTVACPLTADNLAAALHASGAIPFVLTGERDIAGAPPGQYWDGGIIDYHFDLAQLHPPGLILYPHFSNRIVKGWFDKFLPWRRHAVDAEKLVLLCPSEAFTASLPRGKIPDRSDFNTLDNAARVAYWRQCMARSEALAEAFAELITGSDPLRGVTVLA